MIAEFASLVLLVALRGASAADEGAPSGDAAALEPILVTASGTTHQVQRLGPADAQALPPGTSPLKLLEKLPGVHFESADPFGNYEWSARISVRGFDQTRLGFTLDGVPLGDMSYGNNNGLHISRALIAENLRLVELAQGIGSLGTASTSNLGGTLQFVSDDPQLLAGARLAQTVAGDYTRRTFARLDSGEHNGLSAYVSGAVADYGRWKGDGDQRQRQFNAKALYQEGGKRFSAWLATSRRNEVDYVDFSLDSQRRLGWHWDNYSPDWIRAMAAARGQFSGGVSSPDDAYFRGRGLRDDDLLGLGAELPWGESLALRATAYYHTNRGQGHWFTPYQASSEQVPISIRTTEYDIERSGVVTAVAYTRGAHTFEAGFWGEDSVHGLQRNFYFIDGPIDDGFYLHDPSLRVFRQRFDTQTRQLYVQDTLRLLDDSLIVEFGAKSPHTRTDATSILGPRASGRLTANEDLLPQLGLSYRWAPGDEWFASYARNIAAFRPGVAGPFSASAQAFAGFGADLKPEESRTLEAGVRRVRENFEVALALYAVRFDNRLLAIARCSGIVGCASGFANVGSVDSAGAELTLVWKPGDRLRWFNSVSYNRSRYASDYLDGQTRVPTEGKSVVDSPRQLAASELSWRSGPWEFRAGGKLTGKRYISYVNDSSVPSYTVLDASLAYDFGAVGPLRQLRVQLSGYNLGDRRYFATVGSNGFVASDPLGQNYTLLAGAPRQFFVTLDGRFQ